jgi:DNA-binding transcriptional LysR family regulator
MELRHLQKFVAIAEERSFTRAAERLWVAQPGLSSQIRRLEVELGVQLLERHPRGVELTDAGEVFLERARVVLAAADDASATGTDLAAGLLGTLRVGLSTSGRSSAARQLLGRFSAERPQVEVTVMEAYGGVLVRDIGDRRLDAAIVPSPFSSHELHRRPLAEEQLVLAVGRGHRLARVGPVAITDLEGEELVVTGHRDGAAYDRAVADVLSAAGASYSERRGGPGPALLAPVADGQAIAVTTAAGVDRGDVVTREIRPRQTIGFDLVWRESTPSPPLATLIERAAAPSPVAPPVTRTPALAVV